MTESKNIGRRQWLFGLLAGAGSAALLAGCDGASEDRERFPTNVDTSQAATSSDAPVATDDADKDAMKKSKK